MIFTEGIQKTLGNAILRRDFRKNSRKRLIHNLNTASKVGILCMPANKNELKQVKNFISFLASLDIKVASLAILESKKNDIEVVLEKQINFVDRKDFNWFYRPFSPVLKDFINADFDILINLCMQNTLEVNFIICLSKAQLKAGKYFDKQENYCDLTIDIKDSKDISLLIEQLSHYLSVINNTK